MSKVTIAGDINGTGVFTIAAPNGNTNRTLVLPDEAGTVLTDRVIAVNASAPDNSLVVNSAGNVGIGTSAPSGRFSVVPAATPTTVATSNTLNLCEVSNNSAYQLRMAYSSLSGTFTGVIDAVQNSAAAPLAINPTGGSVGIGTTTPSGKFTVDSGRSFFKANNEVYALGVQYSPSTAVMYIGATNSATPSMQFSSSGGGSLATLDSSGNFTATGNVTAYSDERLKKDWEEVKPNFVDQLANVKSGTYTRTDSDERQAGVSAQSLQEILPETVMTGESGMLSVAYGNAAMVAVVELAKEIVKLKEEIKALRAV